MNIQIRRKKKAFALEAHTDVFVTRLIFDRTASLDTGASTGEETHFLTTVDSSLCCGRGKLKTKNKKQSPPV